MSRTSPLISVVVPVYHTEAYLEGCLASLLRQTLRDIELIVVDDGSPGDVATVVARAAVDDSRIRVLRHPENRGVGLARVTGARAARGRYLAFVDSDDEVSERFLEMLHEAAARHDADLVQCALEVHEPDGSIVLANRGGERHDLRGDLIRRAVLAGGLSNSLCNKLIVRGLFLSVVDDLGATLPRVSFAEDLLVLFMLVDRAQRFAHVPDPVYRYMRRSTSITLTNDVDVLARNIESLGTVFGHIRATLTAWAAPRALVDQFFTREFVGPVREHLARARALGTGAPPGLPESPARLGLLGAIATSQFFRDADTAAESVAFQGGPAGDP